MMRSDPSTARTSDSFGNFHAFLQGPDQEVQWGGKRVRPVTRRSFACLTARSTGSGSSNALRGRTWWVWPPELSILILVEMLNFNSCHSALTSWFIICSWVLLMFSTCTQTAPPRISTTVWSVQALYHLSMESKSVLHLRPVSFPCLYLLLTKRKGQFILKRVCGDEFSVWKCLILTF